ncbi:hypothetical protein GCM10010465_23980 [Actinomadura fibrosa]
MSLVLICFFVTTNAQDTEKKSIGEAVYSEYQKNGIDKALKMYKTAKMKNSDKYVWTEWELNRIGYVIMNEDQDLDAAEKVFKLNMEEYPTAANPYDSYADYLLEKGQTDEAKEYFKKSIAIAEKSDKEDEQTRIMSASKGKLAKLEKKDKQLAFLQGDWKVESTGYTDGKEAMTMKSHDKISYNEDVNALLIRHFNAQNESDGIRMIAYDAMDDTFDIAYISPDGMQGIETSTMKMETKSPTEFTFMDKYVSRTGKDVVLKHDLQKISDNELKWVIYEKNDAGEWQKMYAMHMTK